MDGLSSDMDKTMLGTKPPRKQKLNLSLTFIIMTLTVKIKSFNFAIVAIILFEMDRFD